MLYYISQVCYCLLGWDFGSPLSFRLSTWLIGQVLSGTGVPPAMAFSFWCCSLPLAPCSLPAPPAGAHVAETLSGCCPPCVPVTSFGLTPPPSSFLQQVLHQRWACSGHGFFFFLIKKDKAFYFFNVKRIKEIHVTTIPPLRNVPTLPHRLPIFVLHV